MVFPGFSEIASYIEEMLTSKGVLRTADGSFWIRQVIQTFLNCDDSKARDIWKYIRRKNDAATDKEAVFPMSAGGTGRPVAVANLSEIIKILLQPRASKSFRSVLFAICARALTSNGKNKASLANLLLAATAPTVTTDDGKPALIVISTQLAERAGKVETEMQERSMVDTQEVARQSAPTSSTAHDTALRKPKRCKADKDLRTKPKHKAKQEAVLPLDNLNRWEEEDISNPSGKRVLRQILTKMKSLYKPSEVKVAPLYLGYVNPLKNTKRFMSRGQVRSWIKKNKKNPLLRDYFDDKGRRKLAWHVDHIIPASVGGLDHPRNYAIMPEVFNTEFGGWWSAAKAQYITVTAARHALLFAQYVRKKFQRDVSLDDLEMW